MRNIMLLGSALHIGGAERVVANLAKHIDPGRFRVTIAHLKEQGAVGAELAAKGYDVVGIPRAATGVGKYLSFRNLARVVGERGIELIHTHTTYAMTDAALCRLLARPGVKLVHTFHFGNYPHYPARYKLMERVLSRVIHRLVAVGIEQREVIRSTYSLAPRRISTIVNGVELPSEAPDADWRVRLREGADVVIGTICVCSEQKGIPDLLKVAAAVCSRYERVRFAVVGDGPLRLSMQQLCREMKLEGRVIFTGWKDSAGATMLPLFDVFFQPSLWEAMSMVVLEAMAAGKPVVATDVGDNRYVVQDGATGFVVRRSDHAAMAEVLGRLIESQELRERFGENGRQRYAELYGAHSMARSYEQLYAQVLSDG